MFADHMVSEYDKLLVDPFDKRERREWGQVGTTYNELFDVCVMLQGGLAKLRCVQPDAHAFFEETDGSEDVEEEVHEVEYIDLDDDGGDVDDGEFY